MDHRLVPRQDRLPQRHRQRPQPPRRSSVHLAPHRQSRNRQPGVRQDRGGLAAAGSIRGGRGHRGKVSSAVPKGTCGANLVLAESLISSR